MKIKSKKSIKFDTPQDVYDLEVPKFHNFKLASGVVVHNSKDIADSLAGALFNASKNTDMSSLYVIEDFNSIESINEDNSNSDLKETVINNMYNSMSKTNNINDIMKDLKAKSDNSVNTKIQQMRKSLTKEESIRVTDNELEDTLFNSQDDMLIW